MENKVLIGEAVKNKRIALNLTCEQLANSSGLSRQTVFSIENGTGNYSIDALLKVFEVLSLGMTLTNTSNKESNRLRASRINTKYDKQVNRFVTMCIEQYCSSIGEKSTKVYPKLVKKGVVDELTNEYEVLHGMSTIWINDFIGSMLRD